MIIRPMRSADLDQVLNLAASQQHAPKWPLASYLAAINSQTNPQDFYRRIALVAEAESDIQGFAIANLLPPQAELESIVVAIPFQRQGIATHLIEALIEQLQVAGATELDLEVRASNQSAQAFYQRSGFSKSGHRPSYYQLPGEDAIFFKLIFHENAIRP